MKIIITAANNFSMKEPKTVDKKPEVVADFIPDKSKKKETMVNNTTIKLPVIKTYGSIPSPFNPL